jgi:molecular chaperone IbpA
MTYLQSTYDPFTTVGFDRIFDRITRMHETTTKATGYPPYNIMRNTDTQYSIEMAVAGFTEADLDITLKEGILTVKGNAEAKEDKNYVHRGIAARSFVRTFTLADTIEISGASLENGMLIICLENMIPEEKKERKIAISSYKSKPELLVE